MSIEVSICKKLKNYTLDVNFSGTSCRLGILGASGGGKSMTLKCIAGIERPDSGYIRINGRTLFDSRKGINLPPRKRGVGYLFQNYALFPTMTVYENIGISLPKNERREKTENYLRRFHLEDLKNRYPRELSGGEQQRTALARMMIRSPEILMLDEPFSAMDSWLKDQLLREIFDLLEDYGKDTLIVSHNRDEIYQLCSHLAIMDRGHLLTYGKTDDIFSQPETVAGARLTGCKNISRVTVIDSHTLWANDWGISLHICHMPENMPKSIGIRAHHLSVEPLNRGDNFPKNPLVNNTFIVRCTKRLETPFEEIYFFLPAASGENNDIQPLWWKRPKANIAFTNSGTGEGQLYKITLPERHLIFLDDK